MQLAARSSKHIISTYLYGRRLCSMYLTERATAYWVQGVIGSTANKDMKAWDRFSGTLKSCGDVISQAIVPNEEGGSLPEVCSPQRTRDLLPATVTISTTISRGNDFMMQLLRQCRPEQRYFRRLVFSARVMRHSDAGVLIAEQ